MWDFDLWCKMATEALEKRLRGLADARTTQKQRLVIEIQAHPISCENDDLHGYERACQEI